MRNGYRSVICLVVLFLLLSSLLGPCPAGAVQSGGIQVLEQTEESNFHDNLTFHLRARSDGGQITQASLYARAGWQGNFIMVPAETFTPAAEVELTAIWDTADLTVPPFVEVTYYWSLSDSAGNGLTTERVDVEYTDAHHDWKRLEDEHVIVFWYDRPDKAGQAIFEAAQEAYGHVANMTGTTTDKPVRLVIYNTHEDFCYLFAPLACQDWVGGQSFTESSLVVLWGTDMTWLTYEAIPHELAHLFYQAICDKTYVRIPAWFREGLAVYNERTDHSREMAIVQAAVEEGQLASLYELDGRFTSVYEDTISLSYAESYSVIAYMVDTYGEETVGKIIVDLAKNKRFEKALDQEAGLTLEQLEKNYYEWVGVAPTAAPNVTVAATAERQPIPTATAASTAAKQLAPTNAPTVPPERAAGGPALPPFIWALLGMAIGGIGVAVGFIVGRRKTPSQPPEQQPPQSSVN